VIFWGRPLGSLNREKPFNDVLRIALKARPDSLRRIVDRLIDGAEKGNLHHVREIADPLDGNHRSQSTASTFRLPPS
jgi:hypothetical protein